MKDYCFKILSHLKRNKESSLVELEKDKEIGLNKDEILWGLEILKEEKGINYNKSTSLTFTITKEGKSYMERFPEEKLIVEISNNRIRDIKDLEDKIGLIWAKKNEWISIDNGILKLKEKGKKAASSKDYQLRTMLNNIKKFRDKSKNELNDLDKIDILKKRSLITIKERAVIDKISITEIGVKLLSSKSNFNNKDIINSLNREIILNKDWKNRKFQAYEIDAPSDTIYPARIHPLHEFINEIKRIWISMGFKEGDGPIINSAFWNFDVLFTPQDHPARDMHDTFFLSNPKFININDVRVLSKVRKMHKEGWNSELDRKVSKRALLRTHNTVISAHYIKEFGNMPDDKYPFKSFFVGRVFRNESLDYKHLAEFYQSEGVIIGDDLTLSNLIYELKSFFDKILKGKSSGIMIRPSYFPFTEPSLEVFYFDKKHNDYIELGGAGMIREEITKALGTDKRVIAWGLGLDRLLLDKIGLDEINKLYKNKIKFLRERNNL